MSRLVKERDVMLAVQKAIIELGYEPLGEKQGKIYEAIENVPTAYDVDKVVEELEELQCVNPFLTTVEYKHKAIEKVRKGGVDNG